MGLQRIVVTGGSGRLGRYILDRLAGRSVTVADIRPPDRDIAYRKADIEDRAAMARTFEGAQAVIHLAAIPNPRTAPAEITFRVNVQGTWSVLQAAEEAGVKRVVVASSDAILGLSYNPPDWKPQYLPIDEDHPIRPTEFYSLSKEATESICRSYAHRGKVEVVAIRPTHIVFPPEYPELRSRGSDVQNYHFWTYVSPEDVADGFVRALDAPYRGFDAFFISAANGLNERPTLDLVRERWGTVPPLRRPEWFERDPHASLLDITRARTVLGFAPASDWRAMKA